MVAPRNNRPSSSEAAPRSYWERSREPLQVLVFLLPLIAVYEIALTAMARGELSNVAHRSLLHFFDALNIPAISGLYMGGVAIAVVLLTWHVLAAKPWRVSWSVVGAMAMESIVLAVPLVLLGYLLAPATTGAAVAVNPIAASIWEKLIISIGAGLYEEVLFRMVLIGALHTLLVDVARASDWLGSVLAVIVSAAAFAWYHTIGRDLAIPMHELTFLFVAGLYFGAIFLGRGFGIVVATHAVYDIIVLSA